MIDFGAVGQSLDLLFSSFGPWLVVVPGIVLGLIFGATPGLQISMAMAIFLPMTMYMDFIQAMLFLTAIFTGGSFGAGIPAILMNIPGTSSAIATAFDGYPMARKGQHNQALGVALASSVVGALMGYIVLFFMIQPLSYLVLRLGPAEMFVVILWGMTLIASLKGEQVLKGLIAGFVGLLVGTIGFSEIGLARGTMGQTYLLDGVPVIPAMMGMFAASELFKLANKGFIVESADARKVKVSEIFEGCRMAMRYPVVMIRGGLIGVLVGAVPGVGSSVSNLLSYIETKRRDQDPDSFGKGNPKGVVASEAANSSSEGGSMATLLALGIPGGGATAVMLAAFAMHNITGGPQFIRQQTDVVYAIIFANFAQVFLLVIIGLL
ncbi:MAG: tripartite tricarboxylate transporter permease, partial [Halomonas venusta]|nr:tripartite tricarboxylate transporter permease [Halomonas venusta]